MTKKILVTGSSGYIGKHLVKILQNNFEVYGIDLNEKHNSIDIRKDFTIDKEFDAVIHLAALVKVNESVNKPSDYYSTNIIGTINVLNRLKYKNFIFASTGAATKMNSPYAISKKAGEEIVEEYCIKNKIDYTIFRFFNVIGSDGILPTNNDGLFFNLMSAEMLGYINLYGTDYDTKDGTCIRDYVHVNEICYSIIEAITDPANSIENLGHGIGHSVKEIIEIYKKVNNVDFEIKNMPRRSGDIEVSVLDNVSRYMKKLYTIENLLQV